MTTRCGKTENSHGITYELPLEKIKVENNYLAQPFLDIFTTVLKLNHCRELNLSNLSKMTDCLFAKILEALWNGGKNSAQLKKLNISNNPQLTLTGINPLCGLLESGVLHNLTTLDCSNLGEDVALIIIKSLGEKKCPNLKHLKMRSCHLYDRLLIYKSLEDQYNLMLKRLAIGCPNLETIDFTDNKLDKVFLQCFTAQQSLFKSLQGIEAKKI